MNAIQEQRLAQVNDRWPIATWEGAEGQVIFRTDDGDIGILAEDGSAFWTTVMDGAGNPKDVWEKIYISNNDIGAGPR